MIQQINLYQVQAEKALRLSFQFTLQVSAGLIVCLFFVFLYETYNHIKTKKTLQVLESEQHQVLEALEKMKAKIPGPEVKEAYMGQIHRLEADQKIKKDMLSVLTTLQTTQTLGFSRYLSALAAQVSDGIWLTHFKFDQSKNEVALEGVSVRPDNVSHLIEQLSQEPVFNGKVFQVFKLAVDDKKAYINFELSTEAQKKAEQPKS